MRLPYSTFRSILVLGAICTTAAAPASAQRFSPRQRDLLRQANAVADSAIRDPRFRQILMELDSMGAIVWDGARLENIPRAGRGAPTDWVIRQFETRGLFADSAIHPWRKWNPRSSTTASTIPGLERTRLNLWKFDDDPFNLANTLVHERTHTFCVLHPASQYADRNQCDAGYVIGNLAEVLARSRAPGGASYSDSTFTMCPRLCDVLVKRGIMGKCKYEPRETTRDAEQGATYAACHP